MFQMPRSNFISASTGVRSERSDSITTSARPARARFFIQRSSRSRLLPPGFSEAKLLGFRYRHGQLEDGACLGAALPMRLRTDSLTFARPGFAMLGPIFRIRLVILAISHF